MELIYLWIKKYGNFKETDFYFQNSYQFNYDTVSHDLHINNELGEKMPNNFFGENISNLSVIVGDNGAGKTTLLRFIMDGLTNTMDLTGPFIAGFYDQCKKELKIYSHKMLIRNIECKDTKVTLMEESIFEDWISKTKFVYVSNMLDIHDYSQEKPGKVHDASVGGLLRRDYKYAVERKHIPLEENQIYNFFNNEVYRQINFLYQYKQEEIKTDSFFDMLNVLTVKIAENTFKQTTLADVLKKNFRKGMRGKDESSDVKSLFEDMIDQLLTMNRLIPNSGESICLSLIAYHLVINAIKDVAESAIPSELRYKELNCLLHVYKPYNDQESIILYSKNLLERFKEELKTARSRYISRLIPYLSFLNWLEIEFEMFDVEVKAADKWNAVVQIKLNDINKERFGAFFKHYNSTCSPFYFLNFSWGLSTGENNLLNLYSRLHSVLIQDRQIGSRGDNVVNYSSMGKIPCTNILLLIDEADLSFHPKWQIQYINRLLNILNVMFKNCKVQVIITTHSPMMLSDVPKSNVIYLKKSTNDSIKEHSETFGQNVYTLFKDAFFIEQTVGEFSNRIIQEVGSALNELVQAEIHDKMESNDFIDLKYYEYITGIIGEKVIRQSFEAKLQQLREVYRTRDLKNAISLYNKLSPDDRNRMIDYIIQTNEKDQEL
ncbi:AAA family ATPase [Bacillus cereus]